jgi:urease subunit alpha
MGIARGRAAGDARRTCVHNAWQPTIEVDPQTYEVRADGQLLTCEPADVLADGAAVFSVLF